MNNQKKKQVICPQIGLRADKTTSAGFPSVMNACFHAKGQPIPELEFQRTTCLTENFNQCPIYNSPQGVNLPDEIRQPKQLFQLQKQHYLWALFIIFLVIIIFIGVNFRKQLTARLDQIFVPAWQQTQSSITATLPPTSTVVSIPTKTLQPQPSQTATSEPTPSPTTYHRPPVNSLEAIIGQEIELMIIQVREGESLGQFASRYNTTTEAIKAVNYNLPPVLLVDWFLVIPVGIQDTSGLPAFEPIQLQQGGISIEAFTQQLQANIEDIYRFNNFNPGRILTPGEWVLVPRE